MNFSLKKSSLFIFFLVQFVTTIQANYREKQLPIVLREIGHQFLLEVGDSTTRVMPIEEVEGRYLVKFERDFVFVPDALSKIVFQLFEENQIERPFIIEVESCDSADLVHSFEVNALKEEKQIACRGRRYPKGCYLFYFTDSAYGTSTEIDSTSKERSATSYLWWLFMPLLLALVWYAWKMPRKAMQDEISIGQFQFDKKRLILSLKAQKIELSAKEADLLLLFVQNENETLERAFMLNQIWGDEGDYVGRTLDVFISKLRKKIAADPSLKIVNVRGVGYRFVKG